MKKKLLKLVTLFVVMLMLLPVAFAGGQKEKKGKQVTTQKAAVQKVVKKRVKFSVGFRTDEAIDTLAPNENWQYVEMGCIFWPLVYDQLWIMGPAPDYKAIPMLAKSWETKDHKTWIFHLRKNAKFHDGVPVTAEDVAFTIKYLPKNNPSWQFPDVDCQSIKVIDKYTVQFTLKKVLGGKYPMAYWVPILPKHIWEKYKDNWKAYDNATAIGSGPFKLKEFKRGQYIWLVKNSDYWGKKPYVDDVVLKTYGSTEAEYAALKTGEIDMIGYNGISPIALKNFKGAKNITIRIDPGIKIGWLTFNLHKKDAIRDLNVRKAIMYGIDVNRIIQMAFLGYADRADSFMYTELPDHNPNLNQYNYNVDKAKAILKTAGYRDTDGDGILNDPKTGKNLVFDFLGTSEWTGGVRTMHLIKEQLKKIGIDVELKVVDLDTFYDFWYAPDKDKFDIALGDEEPGPHADWIWEFARSWDNGGEGWNCAYYNNPKFDKLLDAMTSETNLQKRREDLFEMQAILNKDLPYGFLFRQKSINPLRTDKFTGFVSTMGGVSTWINPWTYFNVRPVK